VSGVLHILVAQGVPLAPPLNVRLITLLVVEAVLLVLVVLLYIRWVQFKREPLDKWWAKRKAEGLSAKTLVEMEASEIERREYEASVAPPAAAGSADEVRPEA
jgi:hypothetical protein